MRRSFKLLLAVVAILAVLCSGAAFAATESVEYLDGSGGRKTQIGVTVISDATKGDLNTDGLDQEWYVVKGQPKFTVPLKFTNSSGVNIILADGATLDVSVVVDTDSASTPPAVKADKTMTIYAQSTDRATMGCISADLMNMNTGNVCAIGASDLTIQGGIVKARANTANSRGEALDLNSGLTVGADAVVEAVAGFTPLNVVNIESSGDVTATQIGSTPILLPKTKIFGGVFRATLNLSSATPGMIGNVSVEGGWVEFVVSSVPDDKIQHTSGVLINGNTGTVQGTAVITEGMTATLRDGVTLTVEDGATLTVGSGAALDASRGTLVNKGDIENDGNVKLPVTMKPDAIRALGITGDGTVKLDGMTYTNDGVAAYAINVFNIDGGGSGSPSEILAVKGAEIELTPFANDGYEFEGWKVLRPAGMIIPATNRFSMPGSDVDIVAMFKKTGASPTQQQEQGIYGGEIDADKTDVLWSAHTPKDLTIYIDVEFSKFIRAVSIDGELLTMDTATVSNDFGARAGSTIVTIWDKTLREKIKRDGAHKAEIGFTDGIAVHRFAAIAAGSSGGGGSGGGSGGGGCATMSASLVALASLAMIKRRSR